MQQMFKNVVLYIEMKCEIEDFKPHPKKIVLKNSKIDNLLLESI